jgi:hypothetical protein
MGLPEWGHCRANRATESSVLMTYLREKLLRLLIRAVMGSSNASGF